MLLPTSHCSIAQREVSRLRLKETLHLKAGVAQLLVKEESRRYSGCKIH